MGVLPADAALYFPEAVDIVNRYTLPPREKGSDPIVLNNFPVVDKNALFMHGLAAIQNLIKVHDELSVDFQKLASARKEYQAQSLSSLDNTRRENEAKMKEVSHNHNTTDPYPPHQYPFSFSFFSHSHSPSLMSLAPFSYPAAGAHDSRPQQPRG